MVQMTVKAAAKGWLKSYIATNRAPKSCVNAGQRVRDYLEPFLGYKLLSKVSKEDLRAYRLWLEKKCRKPQTVAHILSDARCLFRWCEDSGWLDRSPVPRRLLPKLQERPPDRLTDAEIEAVLGVPEPYAFMVRFGLGTGLRWGRWCERRVVTWRRPGRKTGKRQACLWCTSPRPAEFDGYRCGRVCGRSSGFTWGSLCRW